MQAFELQVDDLLYEVDPEAQTAVVKGYAGEEYENIVLTIPDKVASQGKDYPVVALGDYCFRSVPLTEITLGKNVKRIGVFAFMATELTSVTLNEGLEVIDQWAFASQKGFETIAFPSTVSVIGQESFYNSGLTGEIALPTGLKEVGSCAFSRTGITGYTIDASNNMFDIKDGVLYTEGLKTLVSYPTKKAGESFDVPQGVECIYAGAFFRAALIKEVTLPSTLTSIEADAFAYTGIKTINIPSGVKKLTPGAFYEVPELVITLDAGNTAYRMADNLIIENETQKVVAASWMSGTVNVPEGVTEIANYALYGFPIKEVTLPASVKAVGECAFSYCADLKKVTMPGVETIGTMCFAGCVSLKEFEFPATLRSIGNEAFVEVAFASADLPEGVEKIGDSCFESSLVQSCTIPSTVKEIGDYVFSFCENLRKARLPEGMKVIPSYMFCNCTNLTDIEFPSTIEEIKNDSFYMVPFADQALPASLKTIGTAAFYGCGMTEVVIPDGVTVIPTIAFGHMPNLKRVKLGSGVVTLEDQAFAPSPLIESFEFNEGLESIGSLTVYNSKAITSITIPSTVKEVGEGAFVNCPNIANVTSLAVVPPAVPHTCGGNVWWHNLIVNTEVLENAKLIVPAESVDAYRTAPYWKDFSNIETAGIAGVENDGVSVKEIYSVDGRRLASPQRGINLMHMSDGSVRKVMVTE